MQQRQQQLCEVEVAEVIDLSCVREGNVLGQGESSALTANWLSKPSGVATNVGTDWGGVRRGVVLEGG